LAEPIQLDSGLMFRSLPRFPVGHQAHLEELDIRRFLVHLELEIRVEYGKSNI